MGKQSSVGDPREAALGLVVVRLIIVYGGSHAPPSCGIAKEKGGFQDL